MAIKFGFYSSLLVALGVLGYLVYLDRTITETFEGRRWSVPAQVYAQPLELHPGAAFSAAMLTTELKRLGYRNDPNLRTAGSYKTVGGVLQIWLRPFRFQEGQRSDQRIDVRFSGRNIADITDPSGSTVPVVRLEPAIIGSFFPSHGEDRIILTPDQVPALLRDGLKAIEDRNFDNHVGFSVRGIMRALVVNLRAGERQQGGSTLTQQLVKSYFLSNERTISRKLQEVGMAVILDARFSKEDLLTAYINEIFLGQSGNRAIHGFGLGAQFYYNKPLGELDPQQIATLIAVIRGPSYYNPFRHPERAQGRRDRILQTFLNDKLINEEQYQIALAAPLGVVRGSKGGGTYYPAFMDQVRRELSELYDAEALASAGLRIFTTIQPHRQEHVQAAVSATLTRIENSRQAPPGELEAAALVTDSQTGEILALVGGREGRVDGFNRALSARRPVGSLIKPVVFLTALEAGWGLASLVSDEPITLQPEHGEAWTPKNFDGEHHGQLPLVRALAQSLNLATVNLGLEVGLDKVQQRFSQLLGRQPANRYPSFLLGAENLTPLEMSMLYGNFASSGFQTQPKAVISVLDEFNQPLSHHPFNVAETIPAEHAATINRALEIVMAKGTGRSSPFARQGVAGKTGTSNDNRDSWFAGFDNRYLSVVWVGRDDNKVTGLTGSSGALRVWDAMTAAQSVDPLLHMDMGDLVDVEFETGRLATAECADVVRIPVADTRELEIKPGCGITRRKSNNRLRRWFGG